MKFLITLLVLVSCAFAQTPSPALQRKVSISAAKSEAKRLSEYQKLAAKRKAAQAAENAFLTEWGASCEPGRLQVVDGATSIGCAPKPAEPPKPAPRPAKAPKAKPDTATPKAEPVPPEDNPEE